MPIGLVLFSLAGIAQPVRVPAIHFDVVSIKENQSGEEQGYFIVPPNGDRIIVRNTPMFRVIGFAFNKQRNDLIEGLPDWTRESRWDMEATIPPESMSAFHKMTLDQQKELLQQILESRCGLVARLGMKEVPVYALTVARSGVKMKEVPSPAPSAPPSKGAPSMGWDLSQSRGKLRGRALPMDALLYALSKAGLARPVIDRTGLRGRYDMDLEWSPEDNLTNSQQQSGSNNPPPPSIFTALQEKLGLKLEASKAQIEAVIVTHIERPSAN